MEIIRDSRERKGWEFDGMVVERMDVGDYTVRGFEREICIERKASANELSINLFSKDRKRFYEELDRLAEFPCRAIIAEFPLVNIEQYPYRERLPMSIKRKIRVRPNSLLGAIQHIQDDYGIDVVFCEGIAEARDEALSRMQAFVAERLLAGSVGDSVAISL